MNIIEYISPILVVMSRAQMFLLLINSKIILLKIEKNLNLIYSLIENKNVFIFVLDCIDFVEIEKNNST